MTLYVGRTRTGEHLHLTADEFTALCGAETRVMRSRTTDCAVEAADHWLADKLLCVNCRIKLGHIRDAETNEYAERNRAVSAAKLAHVARHLLDRGTTVEELADAPIAFRQRLKAYAYGRDDNRVSPPSDKTWAAMLALLERVPR